MRSTVRLFMAAILFTAVAGVVSAQNPSPAPPPSAPDVAKPVELPPIPIAEPAAPAVEPAPPTEQSAVPATPAVEPALTADQSAPAVEPAAPTALDPAAAEKPVATTTKRVTKKVTKKPAEKPAIQVSEPSKAAAAAAGAVAVDTTANTPPADPPAAAANTAPLESIAPPPPAAKSAAVESRSEEVIPTKKLGIGSWILFTLALVALAGIARKFLRRRRSSRSSIVDLSASASSPGLKPAHVPRS